MSSQASNRLQILVVKLTSMGDALHLLPALSDLQQRFPDAEIDWLIEDSFAEIPEWHTSVRRVIPVSTRRWRKLKRQNLGEFRDFVRQLRAQQYHVVIDAQGLMKSSVIARLARLASGGKRVGFSASSIKERPAAKLYNTKIEVDRRQHAIDRLRQLFSRAFEYPLPAHDPDYAITLKAPTARTPGTILFVPGTTWASKHLPDQHWRQLAREVLADGYRVEISWGNEAERERAVWIAQGNSDIHVLEKCSLTQLAQKLTGYAGCIAVDTGIGHMAAALAVPAVSVYGSTDARLTGAVGKHQTHIQCAYPCSPCFLKECDKLTEQVTDPPCYQSLKPADIWQALYQEIV
ncbi:MAG: lipopolysaccharide heptosyltransferase I [Pseudomonadota bacterium]